MNGLISSKELAQMFGVSEGTVRNWRSQKKGPPFTRLGKGKKSDVRYDVKEVQNWLRKNKVSR